MLDYPDTPTDDVVDDYHGERVGDPYRWLEDTETAETSAWIDEQNAVTFAHLETLEARGPIRVRVSELWDYTRYGSASDPVPVQAGARTFYFRNDGLQDQPVLWVEEDGSGEPARMLLDPNTLSADGTVAVTSFDVTRDGRRIAYGLASGGSDWQAIRVRDVDTGTDLDERISWVKFSRPSWTHDGAGFFYARYPRPDPEAELLEINRGQQLYYHRLGTGQGTDQLILQRPDRPEWGFQADVTEDGRYVLIHVWQGSASENRLFYLDLLDPDHPVLEGVVPQPLIVEGDASYRFIGNVGSVAYILTDLGAPRRRVVAVDLTNPGRESWVTVVPEDPAVLESGRLIGSRLVLAYLRDAASELRVLDLEGRRLREVALPGSGTVAGFWGRADDPRMFVSYASFIQPTTVYRSDVEEGTLRLFGESPGVPPDDMVTHQVFFTSRDGTRVPMFVTHRRGLVKDGARAVLLYGYGGFNVSLTPFYSVPNRVWLELGGVLAVPNLRGGGEYGEAWHKAGTLERKQNVFDDCIGAAEYLIAEGYTNPDRIAISGASNGGLLVGACMTQRPDLFAVALPAVGVMDMLRFHRFTIGWAWVSDYGSADEPEAFRYLRAYSPLHSLTDGVCYPATLVTTADRDDRVVPGHSFKFVARLQAAQGCRRPVLIRVDRQAGHGAGKPTRKQIDEAADRLAFAWHHLGQGTSTSLRRT